MVTETRTKYDALIVRKRIEYGDRFKSVSLHKQFIPYFNNGKRIKVEFLSTAGEVLETLTGTVGVTTGWVPAFILMRRSSDYGSSWTLGPNDRVIAVQHGRQYIAVA